MQPNPVSTTHIVTNKKVLLTIVAIFAFLSLSAIPAARAASYPLQSSVSWNFVQGTNAGNSYFNMQVTVSGTNAPSHVAMNMGLFFIPLDANANWTNVWNHGASLNYNTGVTSQSVSFTIPFKGAGEYLFVANFQNNAGQMVAQSIVDPKIEPEFR
jgi:hypothetical protein